MNMNQIALAASDLSRSTEFYRGLGLRLIVKSPDYVRFECPERSSTLSLHRVEATAENHGVVVYSESEELDKVVAGLARRGYDFETMPTDERWLWREARLRDPAGNNVCLYYAGENRKNPPWRVPA